MGKPEKTEATFDAIIAGIADPALRMCVQDSAWGNAWSAECYYGYSTDAERWDVACRTAEMILDAPRAYFPELFA
jgi:hypothetical protein